MICFHLRPAVAVCWSSASRLDLSRPVEVLAPSLVTVSFNVLFSPRPALTRNSTLTWPGTGGLYSTDSGVQVCAYLVPSREELDLCHDRWPAE
ncbi:hypothetical protein AAFF_G00158030 [Aldrovandia affinis]|uniref:Uncharacterized protein n=1 Tax=Aldrovandia affinis TaxID=143900 RepID=A0AAD7RNN8_9TELE|nr:hypothetical protein AAFF_G00158030 [Aldrovandia affinis]